MAVLSILVSSLTILIFTAIAMVTKRGLAGITIQALIDCLKSCTPTLLPWADNGSAFGGIDRSFRSTPLPVLLCCLAGSLWLFPCSLSRAIWPPRSTCLNRSALFRSTAPLFTVLLVCVILIVGALDFLPCAQPRPHLGTFADECRKGFLTCASSARILRNP